MRDLGYQGLLVITFLGVAVAGLIYAKEIEPILLNPPAKIQYWNYKNVNNDKNIDENLNVENVDKVQQNTLPNIYLENL